MVQDKIVLYQQLTTYGPLAPSPKQARVWPLCAFGLTQCELQPCNHGLLSLQHHCFLSCCHIDHAPAFSATLAVGLERFSALYTSGTSVLASFPVLTVREMTETGPAKIDVCTLFAEFPILRYRPSRGTESSGPSAVKQTDAVDSQTVIQTVNTDNGS